MEYQQPVRLKDGADCVLRSAAAEDGQAVLDIFIRTHEETDFLCSYPDECAMTAENESDFLQKQADSEGAAEILAEIDGVIVGTAGIHPVSPRYKVRHRCEFGISVAKAYWRRGIGKALTEACIECARKAGYAQMELEVVADNAGAIALYRRMGFVEYGRNPRGFCSRLTGYQELLYMRLEL